MSEMDKHYFPTSSNQAEWCFRAETAKLLGLSVTQNHASLTDGSRSVNTLTDSFQELANYCSDMNSLAEKEDEQHLSHKEVQEITKDMSDKINAAIVAFQFYDRLTQRLEHVTESLNQLSNLVKDEQHLHDQNGWKILRDHIKSSYTMSAEHLMFEAIMKGADIQEALEIYRTTVHEEEPTDDIELF